MTVATREKSTVVVVPQTRRVEDTFLTRTRGRARNLTADQARALTNDIKHRSTQLWLLIEQAHDRKAWAALGYKSWKDYAQKELQMSEARSFQVLDAAKVMRAIEKAGIAVDSLDPPPARVVQAVKSQLPAVQRAAKEATREGTSVLDALRAIATEVTVQVEKDSRPAPDRTVTALAPRISGKVECPGCGGNGLVTKAQAKRLDALIAGG